MDEVFGEGPGGGKAAEDQARLTEIHHRLGLDQYVGGERKTPSDHAVDEKASVQHSE